MPLLTPSVCVNDRLPVPLREENKKTEVKQIGDGANLLEHTLNMNQSNNLHLPLITPISGSRTYSATSSYVFSSSSKFLYASPENAKLIGTIFVFLVRTSASVFSEPGVVESFGRRYGGVSIGGQRGPGNPARMHRQPRNVICYVVRCNLTLQNDLFMPRGCQSIVVHAVFGISRV